LARTRKKKTRRDTKAALRTVLLFGVLGALLIASLYVLRFLGSDRGRFWVIHDFRQESPVRVSPLVKKAVAEAVKRLAIPGGVRLAEHSAQARPFRSWEVQVSPSYSLLQANMVLSAQMEKTGCEVIDGIEGSTRRGSYVKLVVGVDHFPTDVVYLREGTSRIGEEPRALLAVVIDDFGFQKKALALDFFDLPYPLTIAVLPMYRRSRLYAEEAISRGHEVLLHLPMEPLDYPRKDPGRGAVLVEMSPEQIRATVRRDLSQLPPVRGVNNHMGSLATQDMDVMRVVIEELSRDGLFFLDSFTTPRSVAGELAKEYSVPYLRNELFIDDRTESAERVLRMLKRAKTLALRDGKAIVIGHAHEYTLDALKEFLPDLEEEGIKLVYVSELLPKLVYAYP